ncbi:MAG: patatin-like phospholipase family protein [Acidobacteria bacterium]|nr:patatin-like phospholipase family protein [Acidobacteriota bacterium]
MTPRRSARVLWLRSGLLLTVLLATACAHYPVNAPLARYDPGSGYRGQYVGRSGGSDTLMLFVSFSGGGTRAAAFAYGVLEELRDTQVTVEGRRRRLLDEVDWISSVSGGSFTAGYYGLFGDRVFEDFETRFLKKDVEGALIVRAYLNPINWVRLLSPTFGRSDLAAEYYDEHIFHGGTFADLSARKGPMILMNATDPISGVRVGFSQDSFDVICSDLSPFPVARAAAASSAVPVLLSAITLKNYAGSCGFEMPEYLEKFLSDPDPTRRRFRLVNDIRHYLDAEQTRYLHLVDGGVSDNLGLRGFLGRILALGGFWETLRRSGAEQVQKVVFLVVDAEVEESRKYYRSADPPPLGAMVSSYMATTEARYDADTFLLLRESLGPWAEDVQRHRCGSGPVSTAPGACGDIRFYVIVVKFDALKNAGERAYLNGLPTSFVLSDEAVDRLRDAARRILVQSDEFQRLLRDLQ